MKNMKSLIISLLILSIAFYGCYLIIDKESRMIEKENNEKESLCKINNFVKYVGTENYYIKCLTIDNEIKYVYYEKEEKNSFLPLVFLLLIIIFVISGMFAVVNFCELIFK